MNYRMIDYPKEKTYWVIIDVSEDKYLNTKLGWLEDIAMATLFEGKEDCIDYKNTYAEDNFLDKDKIKCIKIFARYLYYDGNLY